MMLELADVEEALRYEASVFVPPALAPILGHVRKGFDEGGVGLTEGFGERMDLLGRNDALTLASWSPSVIADAQLCLVELISNAWRDGDTPSPGVVILFRGNTLRVGVSDRSSALPESRSLDPLSESGRGLHLVAGLAPNSASNAGSRPDRLPGCTCTASRRNKDPSTRERRTWHGACCAPQGT